MSGNTIDWYCPFCDRGATITGESFFSGVQDLYYKNAVGPVRFAFYFIVCPNPKCKRFTLSASLSELETLYGPAGRVSYKIDKLLNSWDLIPPSTAKVFPDYVPKPILEDYQEACLTKNLSPKASATLSRRCLQGMIRDFWEIKKPRLVDEINALEDRVDPLTWKAIDAVRSLGNIGAHMEKDISLIIDVDPDEAQQLIQLVEYLIKDWYITRHEREERLNSVVALAEAKKTQTTPTAENRPKSTPDPSEKNE